MATISRISKIEIEHLWNNPELNFEWKLNQDVNVLAGDNGSGKSTIFNLVVGLLRASSGKRLGIAKLVKITFDNGKSIFVERIKDSIENLELRADKDDEFSEFLQRLKKENPDYKQIAGFSVRKISFDELDIKPGKLTELIGIDFIRTFDQDLKDRESVQKLSDNNVRTELDWQIHIIQQEYLSYQIDLGKRVIELSKSDATTSDAIAKIDSRLQAFKSIINTLFSDTGKQINEKANKISFTLNGEEIKPHQLSSGEKQILLILLTVLVQDEKPYILILDEPEISLHTDWQEQLINSILQLNPNVQIILATHSPFVIARGWANKVFQMSQIKKV